MNRIFHARILASHCLLLLFFTFLVMAGFLCHNGLLALAGMLPLVLLIERLIHTTYTVTPDGRLLIDHGRFSKLLVLEIKDIRLAERRSRFLSLQHGVRLEYNNDRHTFLFPVKEEEFVEILKRFR